MKKNVASQKIGCQMVSATDGSAFTSAVTVSVTVDAGTQATGSVGSGACTHEGNGYHTYAPAQAETNGDLVAFTFTGTGAVPATVQVYTSFPQTGDAYAETQNGTYGLSAIESLVDDIGAAGAGLSAIPWNAAWDAEVQSEVADALAVYAPATAAALDAVDNFVDTEIAAIITLLGTPAGASVSADIAAAKTVADAIKAKTDNLPSDPADASVIAGLIAGLNNLSASQVNAEVVDALATDTYAEPGQGAPAATATLAAKINYIYKAWRNKKEQTATAFKLYADDASTVDQKQAVSDDGTTYTRGEVASGP